MDISNLIVKKFMNTPADMSKINGGDIHTAKTILNFTHKKKRYSIEVRFEQAVRMPKAEGIPYAFDDVKKEPSLWLKTSSTSATKIPNFRDVFPEIDENVDEWMQKQMFYKLEYFTNFEQEDLDESTERREQAFKEIREQFCIN